MIFVYFILTAGVTVFAAVKLSAYADVISEKSAVGGMLVGTLLLAGATSLPEVTTSFSAGIIGNADLAVGNVFGSNLFNLFILAGFDLIFRKRKLLEWASYEHTYSAILGFLLTASALAFLFLDMDATVFGIGIDVLLLIALYVGGIGVINKLPKSRHPSPVSSEETQKRPKELSPLTVRQAGIRFALAALLIMAAGTALSILGDQIAIITGLGSSFVGSFLIAATTSLPEAVAVYVALRLDNINLALGSILGSNMFNMVILGVSDVSYQQGSILSAASGSHVIIATGVIFMTALALYMLRRKKTKSLFSYSLPSILILLCYFISSYLNFSY